MKFFLLLLLKLYLNQQNILTGNYACKSELTSAFGLQGYDSSSYEEVHMCPQLDYSCCNPKTQLDIYKQWIFTGQEVKIKQVFEFLGEVYEQIISIAEKYGQIAKKYEQDFGDAMLNDCHVITKKILEFNYEEIINYLKDEVEKTINFYRQSISGFYCAICDGKSHEFIDLENKTIQYSQKFCRQTIESTLKFKLYFETNLVPFLNLGTRVLYTCDTQGQFIIDGVPQNVQIADDFLETQKLEKCFETRNQSYYLKHCKYLCEEFQPTIINEKLFPKLLKYSNFIINIHKRLKVLEEEEIGFLKKEGDKIDMKQEDSFWSLPSFYDSMIDINNILKNVVVYVDLAKLKMEKFKGKIDLKADVNRGIDFYYQGINSQITENIYKQKVFEYEFSNQGLKKYSGLFRAIFSIAIISLFNQQLNFI